MVCLRTITGRLLFIFFYFTKFIYCLRGVHCIVIFRLFIVYHINRFPLFISNNVGQLLELGLKFSSLLHNSVAIGQWKVVLNFMAVCPMLWIIWLPFSQMSRKRKWSLYVGYYNKTVEVAHVSVVFLITSLLRVNLKMYQKFSSDP